MNTTASGIFGNTVVGTYVNASGSSGFTETNNVYTTLSTPLAPPNASNPNGQIEPLGIQGNTVVGDYFDGNFFQGFTETGGVFTTISYPNTTPCNTVVGGIWGNTVVGTYDNGFGTASQGFIETAGAFSPLNFPGANSTSPSAIYNNTVVGTFNKNGNHGFIEQNGMFTQLDDPLGTGGTFVTGIYGDKVVGHYLTGTGNAGFGFIEENGIFTTLQYPGSTSTAINGIDDNNLVGTFTDSSGHNNGFIATPEPQSLLLLTLPTLLMLHARMRKRSVSAND